MIIGPTSGDELQLAQQKLTNAEREALRLAAFPSAPVEARWPSGISESMRGHLRMTYMVRGAVPDDEHLWNRADCTVTLEERAASLGAVHLSAFRAEASRILSGRGIDAQTCESGVLVVELHPADVTSDGRVIVSEPESDHRILRHIAGYRMCPTHWTTTTTSRNYAALVGEGDLVILVWSGNLDYWENETRDRVFREFGDLRTLDVAWLALGANTAMNTAYRQVQEVAKELASIDAAFPESTTTVAELRRIGEVHRRIQEIRALANRAVLLPSTGFAVSTDSALRRLTGLHLELADELIPERMTQELERELEGLLHDVEFAMSRRSDEGLRQVIAKLGGLLQGSREEKRARFVQSVVILILAGAALFTGIMTIPGRIFPGTYPTAALWAVMIVLTATTTGLVLFWAYQRRVRSRRLIPMVIGILVGSVALVTTLGLADVVEQRVAMTAVLALSFAAAALGALIHDAESPEGRRSTVGPTGEDLGSST